MSVELNQEPLAMGATHKYKAIDFAYPSSDAAAQCGKSKTGCWFVVTFAVITGKSVIVGHRDSKKEAFEFGQPLPHEWHHIWADSLRKEGLLK